MSKMSPSAFFNKYGLSFIVATQGTGLFPSVKAAQAAIETGWGATINEAGNNMFGIKADASWFGQVISNTTKEVVNGITYTYTGTGKIYSSRSAAIAAGVNTVTLFRKYLSVELSIIDHTKFLTKNSRYKTALQQTTPEAQARALQAAGYASATSYANSIISIINTYDLKSKLDEKKK